MASLAGRSSRGISGRACFAELASSDHDRAPGQPGQCRDRRCRLTL